MVTRTVYDMFFFFLTYARTIASANAFVAFGDLGFTVFLICACKLCLRLVHLQINQNVQDHFLRNPKQTFLLKGSMFLFFINKTDIFYFITATLADQ